MATGCEATERGLEPDGWRALVLLETAKLEGENTVTCLPMSKSVSRGAPESPALVLSPCSLGGHPDYGRKSARVSSVHSHLLG